MKIPEFQTNRLILKDITIDDIPSYTKHFVDYEVIEHLAAAVPWPYPENGVEWFLKEVIWPHQGKTRWMWGIFEKNSPTELIGCVDLWRVGHPENRGFWLGKKFWDKGYMTEAVEPVMNYAFNELGFEKLVFANAVGNLKSRRVKEKTGCRLIDIRSAKFVNPKYTEHEIWELTKEDWLKSADKVLINQLKDSKSEEDRKKCIPLLQEYLKANPSDAVAWYDLAGCYDFCGFEKEAEPCYWKTYELGWKSLPSYEHAGFFVGFGSTLRNNLKFDDSLKILNEGVESFPNYPALKVFKAFTLYSLGQFQSSTKILFDSIDQMPEKAFDGYERAIKWYVENLETHPEIKK